MLLESFEAGRLSDVLEAQRAEFAAVADPLDAEHFAGLVLDTKPLPDKAPPVALQLVEVAAPFYAPFAVQTLRRAADAFEEYVKLLAIYPPHRRDIAAYKIAAESNARGLRRIADHLDVPGGGGGSVTEAQRRPDLGEG